MNKKLIDAVIIVASVAMIIAINGGPVLSCIPVQP